MQKDSKTQNDDDFEKLLDEFINSKLDCTQEAELPFPKEMREAGDLAAHLIRFGRYLIATFAVSGLYPMLFNVIDKKLDKKNTSKEDTTKDD